MCICVNLIVVECEAYYGLSPLHTVFHCYVCLCVEEIASELGVECQH